MGAGGLDLSGQIGDLGEYAQGVSDGVTSTVARTASIKADWVVSLRSRAART